MPNLGFGLFMHTALWPHRLWYSIPPKREAPRTQPRLSITLEAYADVDTVSFDV